MKARIRVATDEYEFIELDAEGTVIELFETYKELKNLAIPKVGLAAKDFNTALDRYLTDGTGETEVYLAMSPRQQGVFQEIKKAMKRMEAKENRLDLTVLK